MSQRGPSPTLRIIFHFLTPNMATPLRSWEPLQKRPKQSSLPRGHRAGATEPVPSGQLPCKQALQSAYQGQEGSHCLPPRTQPRRCAAPAYTSHPAHSSLQAGPGWLPSGKPRLSAQLGGRLVTLHLQSEEAVSSQLHPEVTQAAAATPTQRAAQHPSSSTSTLTPLPQASHPQLTEWSQAASSPSGFCSAPMGL